METLEIQKLNSSPNKLLKSRSCHQVGGDFGFRCTQEINLDIDTHRSNTNINSDYLYSANYQPPSPYPSYSTFSRRNFRLNYYVFN